MSDIEKPELIVIAGPNGAGKSTLTSKAYPELIKNTLFINPDEIAAKLVSLYPDKSEAQRQVMAAREALRMYEGCFLEWKSFSIETTLAGNTPLKTMHKAKEYGYYITLAFVGIESSLDSITRVSERVSIGGHNVPVADILRRYERSLQNLPLATKIADKTLLFDNSHSFHQLHLYLGKNGVIEEIYQPDLPDWLKRILSTHRLKIGQPLAFIEAQCQAKTPLSDAAEYTDIGTLYQKMISEMRKEEIAGELEKLGNTSLSEKNKILPSAKKKKRKL